MFNINDVVKLKRDIPEEKLKADDLGTIVEILQEDPVALYEVEFCNDRGETITTLSIEEKDMQLFYTA
jgi:hypothetical protein